jgi:hypothetical protein
MHCHPCTDTGPLTVHHAAAAVRSVPTFQASNCRPYGSLPCCHGHPRCNHVDCLIQYTVISLPVECTLAGAMIAAKQQRAAHSTLHRSWQCRPAGSQACTRCTETTAVRLVPPSSNTIPTQASQPDGGKESTVLYLVPLPRAAPCPSC